LTPAPIVTEWTLLKDTYWIVYPEYTPAYELQGNSLGTVGLPKTDPPTITRILDQTVYYIQDVDPRGYLWGYVAVALVDPSWQWGAHPQSSYGTLLSPITPEGDWILSTTVDQGNRLQAPSQTWATGKMVWMNVDGKDQWTMENWKVGGYVHWAYMIQAKPGGKYWDNLPIVNQSIPEFLAPALAFAPVNPVPYISSSPEAFVTSPGEGGDGLLKIWDTSGTMRQQFTAFPFFKGSISVAYGDLNGDGVKDIVAAAGPGGGPHVKVFDGENGDVIASFYAYDSRFNGGVSVATGDVNGDGILDIITGAGAGGGPHVKAFALKFNGGQAAPQVIASFFAYDANFPGGVSVASGNIDGLGPDEIITGAGAGGGPHVKAFALKFKFGQAAPQEIASFFAYDANFPGGVSVASGNIDGLDADEIITGAGAGGGPHVKAFSRASDGTLNTVSSFFAYEANFRGGVDVGAMRATPTSDLSTVLTGAGPGGGPHVRSWNLTNPDMPQEQLSFFAYDASFQGGVAVS
jgi:hypothetical protein